MKYFNNLILSFFLLGAITFQMSCTNSGASINSKGTVIQGTMKNAQNLSLYFDRVNFDNSNHMYPKAEIDGNGKFQMNIEDKLDPGIYRLRIGAKKSYLILDGTEKTIKINGDLSTFDQSDYTITGAPASESFSKYMKEFMGSAMDKNISLKYISTEKNSVAAAFAALNSFNNDYEKLDLLKSVRDRLKSDYPASKYSSDFDAIVSQMEARYAQIKATESIKVGLPAPDIKLEDPSGKEIALSDLKGKIVLLDFWASWCGPCRKANPHVVETYQKYKNQGFTVYSVSLDGINPRMMNRFKTEEEVNKQLDAAKKRWVAAIEKDKLTWNNHVSDLKYWNSIAAKTYGVRSIPQTFLIDRDGNIAAINPRFNLEEKLSELL